MQALNTIKNSFETLNKQHKSGTLNGYFVQCVNLGISVSLQDKYSQKGLAHMMLNIVCDILVACDYKSLRQDLIK